MPVGVIGAIGSVASGVIGAGAASDAAAAQTAAAERELALQREIYEETSANFDPYRQGGGLGFQAYLSEMGLADRPMIGGTPMQIETINPTGGANGGSAFGGGGMFGGAAAMFEGATPRGDPAVSLEGMSDSQRAAYFRSLGGGGAAGRQTQYRVGGQTFNTMEEAQAYANANRTGGREFGGFQQTPGYQFELSRGQDAIASSGAARGNYLSGANLAGAMEFGQGLANREYGNYLNRLQGIGQQGQAAAGNQAAAGQAYAAGAGNALAGIGNAQAAGSIGAANAWTGATNNLMGTLGYLNSQPGGFGGNANRAPSLFGGNSWG